MEYREILNRATLLNEAVEVKKNKNKLINETKNRLVRLKKDLEEIISDRDKRLFEKELKPSLFSRIKNPINFNKQIADKENEIRIEAEKLSALENGILSAVVDFEAIENQASALMLEQSKLISKYRNEIIEVQQNYNDLLKQYNNEIGQSFLFNHRATVLIQDLKSEEFVPTYPREKAPVEITASAKFDERIEAGHGKRAENTSFSRPNVW